MSRLRRIPRPLRLFAVFALAFMVLAGATWLDWRFDRDASYTERWDDQTVTYTPRWRLSPELRALRTLAGARDLEILSLEPWTTWAPSLGADAADARCGGKCLDGNRVLGRLPVRARDRAAIVAALTAWMHDEPSVLAMCAPEFRHAIAWHAAGRRYEVLLCFSCGMYQLRVDGKPTRWESQGGHPRGGDLMNARFRAAGIRHFENATEQWVSGGGAPPVGRASTRP